MDNKKNHHHLPPQITTPRTNPNERDRACSESSLEISDLEGNIIESSNFTACLYRNGDFQIENEKTEPKNESKKK